MSDESRVTDNETPSEFLTMPVPRVAPFGLALSDPASAAQEIWDAFVKPDQEADIPQSVEMRMLMALLRAFVQARPCTEGSDS